MGRRGPKPTPTAELAARGSWLAKTRTDEPEAPAGVPTPRPDLQGEARAYWFRLWPHLEQMHIASPLYHEKADALCRVWASLCDAWASYAVAENEDQLDRAILRLNKLLAHFNRYASDFGLSPADKTRVRVESNGKEAGDNLAAKFGIAQ